MGEAVSGGRGAGAGVAVEGLGGGEVPFGDDAGGAGSTEFGAQPDSRAGVVGQEGRVSLQDWILGGGGRSGGIGGTTGGGGGGGVGGSGGGGRGVKSVGGFVGVLGGGVGASEGFGRGEGVVRRRSGRGHGREVLGLMG